ncbi:hypothetical protein CC1G_05924 [Coprinopsis cinerea okayama7|uniref:Microbial-type PARG catalytic domain-containing protein n=1 Tax=Coprinopsis cinerea (strain Okayama-7 / 130 / ATCC MYA-4618 / FGSC 9003) TaxID=240176 RepID=A8NAH3_COPC7|nr:hypothetical protein CC1G_05924 [Coprinopsis cinerea okayama7\|eukprot:XP_001831825.2 hypothetical protein CC1G_05924 [Coprinopsis cinerea okayama7\
MTSKTSLTLAQRQRVAQDTIKRSPQIIAEHASAGGNEGPLRSATADSTFISEQLPSLDQSKCPNAPESQVQLVNSDAFTAARRLIEEVPEAHGSVAVLNLASDVYRAGGWVQTLSKTQEEALCYSSTLYETLKESYYPWPNVGPGSVAGVFSPGVVIFKDDLDNGCGELPAADRRIVSVITVAAPRNRLLTEDGENFQNPSVLEDLQGKIRLVYRMAAHHGQQYLILGAMGCGAYRCPPKLVATQMKEILLEPEFNGWFKWVIFAIYSRPDNGPTNFDIFSEIFKDTTIGKKELI